MIALRVFCRKMDRPFISFLKSEDRAVKRSKPKKDYKKCPAENYPNNKEHTMKNEYKADKELDKTEDKECAKAYNTNLISLVASLTCLVSMASSKASLHCTEERVR